MHGLVLTVDVKPGDAVSEGLKCLRELPWPTEVHIRPSSDGLASTMTIVASDRPGLLALIGLLFVELDLQLLSAKIATLGERVEDTFVIQTAGFTAVPPGEPTYVLENTIRQQLDMELGVAKVGQAYT